MDSIPAKDAGEPRGSRLRAALAYGLVLAAAESVAAVAAGASELGLYAVQAALAFALGSALALLPVPGRILRPALLAGLGAFHAAFAWLDVDRELAPLELAMLAAMPVVLALAVRLLRPRPGSAGVRAPRDPRAPGVPLAAALAVQALWCGVFLFPIIDTRAEWVVPATWASACLAPAFAFAFAQRLCAAPRRAGALLAAAVLVAVPLLGARPFFWRAHRLYSAEARSPGAARPDVLLIVLDTVRADRMSLYGHSRPTTPRLERFAERATVYERAQSQAVWTLPGHASIFTGLYPSEHQAEWKDGVRWQRKLQPEAVTQAERFALGGYRTAAVSANAFLAPPLGLSQGFQWLVTGRSPSVYLTLPALAMGLANAWDGAVARQRLGALERTSTLHATEVNRLALEWLDRTAHGGPRFLVLNYMEAHDQLRRLPCAAPRFGDGRSWVPDNLPETDAVWAGRASVAPEHAQRLADWYDSELACLDLHLGELFDALDDRRLLDGMLVAITSDHGHLLGEHDAFDHEAEVWRELVHVPLIVKRTGQRAGARCGEPAETCDLAALLPWLAGLGPADAGPLHDGRADLEVAAALAGPPPPGSDPLCPLLPGARTAVSEAPERVELARMNPRYATRWTALLDGEKKYFVDGDGRVFVADLTAPGLEAPREPTDEERARANELLDAWRHSLVPLGSPPDVSSPEEEAEAAERLRLLEHQGYAGG